MSHKSNSLKGATARYTGRTRPLNNLMDNIFKPNQPAPSKTKKINKTVVNSMGQIWTQHHRYAIQTALHQLRNTPIATLHTIIVIALALSLPAALQVLIKNADQIADQWQNTTQMSLYLRADLSEKTAQALQATLTADTDIEQAQLLTKTDALNELKTYSGFADAIDMLNENPLPAVIIVSPDITNNSATQIKALYDKLSQLDEVAFAEMDFIWIQRLFAMIKLIQQISLLITVFLILMVIFIISNTIRLLSQNYYQEIKISKLVGATDSFVRRPFLYAGLLFGFFGSLLACLLVSGAVSGLRAPINELTALYHTHYFLESLNLFDILTLLLVGMLLGFGGAYMAVNRFLQDVNKGI